MSQEVQYNAGITFEIWRNLNETGDITSFDANILYMIAKPVCQGCDRNNDCNPNCFCALIPPPNRTRRSDDLWRRLPNQSMTLRASADSPAGLKNLGSTCYANSILQCLYMNSSFREGVFCVEPEVLDQHPVLKELVWLFAKLQASTAAFIDPAQFIETLKLDKGVEQDGHEFLTMLLPLLERCLSQSGVPKAKTMVQDLFCGRLSHVTTCSKCGNISSKTENFHDLNLKVKGLNSLDESLVDYLSVEELRGDNQYSCESCKMKVDATRRIKLETLPKVLNFHLKRCIFLPETSTMEKITSAFDFPGVLDMQQRLAGPSQENWIYDLSAVLIHKGTAVRGHYIAWIKDRNTGQWWEFNDEEVSNLGLHPFGEGSSSSAESSKATINEHAEIVPSDDASLLMYTLRRTEKINEERPIEIDGCKKLCKHNPNCFCGPFPPPHRTPMSGLWKKLPNQSINRRASADAPAGLAKIGATCYANSILQCLYMNSSFREGVFSVEPEVLGQQPVLNELFWLFSNLQGAKDFIDSAPFIEILGLDKDVQLDSHKFFIRLLRILERCLSHSRVPKAKTIVEDLFRGSMSHVTTCSKCGNISFKTENYHDLNLKVKGLNSLNESLEDYLSVEELRGDNQNFCESCKMKVDATRRIKLETLPKVLNFQLKRYVFLPETSTMEKITSAFDFPGVLDMQQRLAGSSHENWIYDLSAVLIHKGTAVNEGLYIARIKDRNTGQWWEFNDEEVSNLGLHPFGEGSSSSAESSKATEHAEMFSSNDVYMLMYTLRRTEKMDEGRPIEIDGCKKSLRDSSLPSHLIEKLKDEIELHLFYCNEYITERQEEVRSILSEAPVRSLEEPFYWVYSKWLTEWTSNITTTLLDNTPIQCMHGKVRALQGGSMKRFSKEAWTKLIKHGGGPPLTNLDYCKDCLLDLARSVVGYKYDYYLNEGGDPYLFELTRILPRPKNQLNDGTCVAHSSVNCLESRLRLKKDQDERQHGPPRLSIKYFVDSLYRNQNHGGLSLRAALDFLLGGVPSEADYPFENGVNHPANSIEGMVVYNFTGYVERWFDAGDETFMAELLLNIAAHGPMVGEFWMRETHRHEGTEIVEKSGPFVMENKKRSSHAVLLTGFVGNWNEQEKRWYGQFVFMNSFGEDWGGNGFGYMTAEALDKVGYGTFTEVKERVRSNRKRRKTHRR